TVLLMPSKVENAAAAAEPEVVVVAAHLTSGSLRRRVFFRASSRHALAEIAAAFGVSTRDLASWNALNEEARLSDGMVLQILVPKPAERDRVRFREEEDAHILLAGSKGFHEYFEGLKGKRRVEVVVKGGDTLAKIGGGLGMSVGSMER